MKTLLFLVSIYFLLEVVTIQTTRTSNGKQAEVGQFKSVVFVKHGYKGSGLITNCTGSIISQQWVVTAAHCLTYYIARKLLLGKEDAYAKMIAGIVDSSVINEEQAQTRYAYAANDSTAIVPHPKSYDIKELNALKETHSGSFSKIYVKVRQLLIQGIDIAVLHTKRPFHFDEYVGQVVLSTNYPTSGTLNCKAVSFGQFEEGSNFLLKYIPIEIGGKTYCQEKIKSSTRMTMVNNMTKPICGFNDDEDYKDVCQVDSGGPILCTKGVELGQYGVASFHDYRNKDDCGLKKYVMVYVFPGLYVPWITGIKAPIKSENRTKKKTKKWWQSSSQRVTSNIPRSCVIGYWLIMYCVT